MSISLRRPSSNTATTRTRTESSPGAATGSPQAGLVYEKDYGHLDEWTRRFPKMPLSGKVIRGQQLSPEHEFRRCPYLNEFLLKYDVCEMACISARAGPSEFETLSLYRGPAEPPMEKNQLALLGRVAPHLEVALATQRKLIALEAKANQLEAAFHFTQSAFLIIDQTGRVTLANRAAESILAERNGLLLKNSRLSAHGVRENNQLRARIAQGLSRDPEGKLPRGGSLVIPRADRKPLYLFIAPASDDSLPSACGGAIVCISDPERKPQLELATLRQLFSLTPAESRLTLALLSGQSLSESSDSLGVGRETVRTQLKSILRKTGARRHSELLQILNSLNPSPHGGP